MYIQEIPFNFIILLAGVLLFTDNVSSLRGSALVAELKAKAKAALLAPTETVEEIVSVDNNSTGEATNMTVVKTKSLLTGNPQKDYIYDPNLPRELNGYNLTDYPFYNSVPGDIDFKCDGLHDGFYASVPHKCQLYHHCLFGTRYDFLCANYTAFDQKTFICHFVSEVDCDNSPKHYDRNEALYKSASTAAPVTTSSTTTTPRTTTAAATSATLRPRRRRPYRRRRPVYDYYYDDQYDDEEYYDDEDIPPPPRRKMNRKHRPHHNKGGLRDEDDTDVEMPESRESVKPSVRPSGPTVASVYARPRAPPKVRRPVPINERDKYQYKPSEDSPQTMKEPQKTSKGQQKKQRVVEDEYYDEDEEDYDEDIPPPPKKSKPVDYLGESSAGESHRSNSRFRQRQQNHRKHDRYEDEYDEEDRPTRPNRKKLRHEEYSRPSRPNRDRSGYRTYSQGEEAVPAERPGYISGSSRKQIESENSRGRYNNKPSRPIHQEEDDEEYYDDDEEEEEEEDVKIPPRKNQRNGNIKSKEQTDYDYPEESKGRNRGSVDRNRGKADEKTLVSQRASNRNKERPSPGFSRTSTRIENDEETPSTKFVSGSSRTVSNNNKYSKPSLEVEGDVNDYEEEEYEDKKAPPTPTRNNERYKDYSKQPTRSSDKTQRSNNPSTPQQNPINNPNQGFIRNNFRNKASTAESIQTSTLKTTTSHFEDFDERRSTLKPQNVEYKPRLNPSSYDLEQERVKENNKQTKENSEYDDYPETINKSIGQSSGSALSRPSVGIFRRPVKPVTELYQEEMSTQKNFPSGPGQHIRRVKVESIRNESLVDPQQKYFNSGGYYRRLEKPIDTYEHQSNPQNSESAQQSSFINTTNRFTENQPARVSVKRLKVVDLQSRENIRPLDEQSRTEFIKEFDSSPISPRPVDDSINAPVSSLPAINRRPIKQRIKEIAIIDPSLTKQTPESGIENNYQKTDSAAIVTLRSNKGFLSHRGKVPLEYETSTSRLAGNSNTDLLSRNPQSIDITAPGPSGPGIDYRPSGFTLDIPEEEYDVTLNDALQPSTLHPTRSLVDYQQNRFKSRGFQSTLPQPSAFANRGASSFLTPAASQQYITQIQSTNGKDRDTQPSGSNTYIDKKPIVDRQQTSDSQRYETLVLTGPASQQWITQRNPRLTEWFW